MASLRGLSTLLAVLKKVCKVIAIFKTPLREFVPVEARSSYDTAMLAITASCEVIMSIDWLGDETGINQG